MSSQGPQGLRAPVSGDEFRRACGRFATGISIAGAVDAQGTAHGLTVSSFTSVSLEPPLILICLGHEVTMIEVFRQARYFGLSFLREDAVAVSRRFATKGLDRFDAVEWVRGETGVPLLANALATLECASYQRIVSGDHDILVGEVVRTEVAEGEPLIYYASRYRKLAVE